MNIFSFILTIIMSALMIASNTIASVIPGIIPEAKTEEEHQFNKAIIGAFANCVDGKDT